MPSFEIPDGPANVTLKRGATPQDPLTGNAVYAVTNKAANGITGRLSVQVTGATKNEWFAVEGESERPFAPGETQTVNVAIKAPHDSPAGEHKFRLRVVAVNDPDNDHMESPIGTVIVPEPVDTDDGFPWWILAVAIGILLVIVFVVTAFVWPGFLRSSDPVVTPPPPPPPPVSFTDAGIRNATYEAAAKLVTDQGFTPKRKLADDATGVEPDHVIDLTPPDAAKVVTLTVDPGVPMPDFVGLTKDEAYDRAFRKVQIKFCRPSRPLIGPNERVLSQPVGANLPVKLNSPYTLRLSSNDTNVEVCPRIFNVADIVANPSFIDQLQINTEYQRKKKCARSSQSFC